MTHRGVRPGDPVADVVFVCVFSLYLRALIPRLAQLGVEYELPAPMSHLLQSSERPSGASTTLVLAYMDDFAIPLVADDPAQLLLLLRGAADALGEVAHSFGMCANSSAGKTEAVAVLRGRGLKEARASLAHDSCNVGRILLENGSTLRVVPSYRHLGFTTGARDHSGMEAAQRVQAATSARHALGRVVLGDRRLSFATRLHLAKACIKTRLLFGTGTWNVVAPAALKILSSAWAATLRRVVLQHRPPQPGCHVETDAVIRARCGEPPMARQLSAERLRYYARVEAGAPDFLRALIGGSGGQAWRKQVAVDLNLLRISLAPLLDELGDATTNLASWSVFVKTHAATWKCYVRKYLVLPASLAESSAEDYDEADGWLCGACAQAFPSLPALKAHRLRVHDDRCALRLRYAGSRCPHCHWDHHSRLRLLTHLRVGAKHCVLAAANGERPLLPAAVVLQGDADDAQLRRAAKRLGTFAQAGPPAFLSEEWPAAVR